MFIPHAPEAGAMMPRGRTHRLSFFLLATAALPLSAGAQGGNPYDGDPAAIRAGRALFANRCAECHGADAKGLNGPDLTALWASGIRDERVFEAIREGIAGSIMPAFPSPEQETWAVVAYLKSVSTVPAAQGGAGDATRGRELFEATCSRCHTVAGSGGVLGPDLSRIGRVRSREQLARSVRDPSAAVARGFKPVTLVTREGERIRAVVKGEDAFSIQVMDTGGRLQGYRKAGLRDVEREERSLMPAFGPERLSDAALEDLLRYLETLR
jgi:putative heme-binding domain-containing protein